MTERKAYYCTICWQEFDHPLGHDEASAFQGERLNGHCPGDIQRVPLRILRPQSKPVPSALLDLDQGPPLECK